MLVVIKQMKASVMSIIKRLDPLFIGRLIVLQILSVIQNPLLGGSMRPLTQRSTIDIADNFT